MIHAEFEFRRSLLEHTVTVALTFTVRADGCGTAENAVMDAIDSIPWVDCIVGMSYLDANVLCDHGKSREAGPLGLQHE